MAGVLRCTQEVKKEASDLVLPLLPGALRQNPSLVPIMTLGDGIGRRVVLETASCESG